MKLTKSHKNSWSKGEGKGYILYGQRPDNKEWLERWYPIMEKALAFCSKRNWNVRLTVD